MELIIKIEGFAILLPILTEIGSSQSDHPIILREYSLGFLEKKLFLLKFYICSIILIRILCQYNF